MLKFKPIFARILLYFLLIITVFSLQTANFLPKIYNYSYDLLPLIAISLSILAGIHETVILTFLISFLCDFNVSSIDGLNSVFLVTAVIIIHFITQKFFTKTIITNMLFVSITILTQKIFNFIYYYLSVNSDNFLLFLKISCAEVLIATLLSPVIFVIIYLIKLSIKDGV